MQVGCGAHEDLELAQRQRLGQLMRSRHVSAAVGEVVARETATCRKRACHRAMTCGAVGQGFSLERGEGGVPLQALCERRATLSAEFIAFETATSNRTGAGEVHVTCNSDKKMRSPCYGALALMGQDVARIETWQWYAGSRVYALERGDARVPLDHTGQQSCSCFT